MKLLTAILSVFIFSSFSSKFIQQKSDCEAYTIGNIKIINQTGYALKGTVCLRNVDKRTGEIHGLFCPRFNLGVGEEMTYRDVLEGNASYKYGIYLPDPNNFKQVIYSNEKKGNTYIESCKTVELIFK